MSWHRAPSLLLAEPAQVIPFLHRAGVMGTTSRAELLEGQLISARLNFHLW